MVDHPTSGMDIPEEDAPDAGLDEAQAELFWRGVNHGVRYVMGPPKSYTRPDPSKPDLEPRPQPHPALSLAHPLAAEAAQEATLAYAADAPSAIRPPQRPFAAPPAYARGNREECEETSAHTGRPSAWTPDRRARFLDALSRDGSVVGAARAVGLSPRAAYQLRAREPGFEKLWAAALHLAQGNLSDRLWSRAIDGVVETRERDRGDGTKTVTVVRRFDNRLALSLLTRLDRHAAEAAATGRDRATLALAGHWDELVEAVAADRADAAAQPLLRPGWTPPDPLEELRAEDEAADDADGWIVAADVDGEPWTDLPAPDGWDGTELPLEDVPFPPELGIAEADPANPGPPFRTLSAQEREAWDARLAAREALEAAASRADPADPETARAAWLARTRALTARLLATAAELAGYEEGTSTPAKAGVQGDPEPIVGTPADKLCPGPRPSPGYPD